MSAMPPVRLENADTPERLGQLSTLAHIIWHQHYVPIIGRAQVEYMLAKDYSDAALARDRASGVHFTLALRGDRSVGFAAVSQPTADAPSRAWMDKLYVIQEARNLGVGSRLVQRAATQVVAFWAADELALRVNRRNDESIAAYEAMGFSIAGEDVRPIGNGFVMDDYLMVSPITRLQGVAAMA